MFIKINQLDQLCFTLCGTDVEKDKVKNFLTTNYRVCMKNHILRNQIASYIQKYSDAKIT